MCHSLSIQNMLLPASDRIPPQTRKKPTGPFDRAHLLQHLKTQAAESTIGEDYVPFVKKTPKETPAQVVHIHVNCACPKYMYMYVHVYTCMYIYVLVVICVQCIHI